MGEPMRIAFVSERINDYGGIERYVLNLAKRMSKGNEIHLFASSVSDVDFPAASHEVRCARSPKELFALSFPPAAARETARYGFDIVHGQNGAIIGGDVCTSHSCHLAYSTRVWKSKGAVGAFLRKMQPMNRILLRNERRAYTSYKHIIAVSEGLKDDLMEHYGVVEERIRVIPLGTDLEAFDLARRAECRERIRRRHGLREEDVLLINVTNEFRRKGVDVVIESLALAGDKRVKLIVVGKDDPAPYIELARRRGVSDRVIFAGVAKREELPDYLLASDIFVCPTIYESFLLGALESAAAGLPVLMTPVGGFSGSVRDGYNGYLISRDPKALAGRIAELAGDGDLRKELGRNARKTAEGFGWERTVDETLRYYGEILEEKSRR